MLFSLRTFTTNHRYFKGISYIPENKWFSNGWRFVFRYRSTPKNYVDWTIKIVFSEEVTNIKVIKIAFFPNIREQGSSVIFLSLDLSS